MGTLWNTPVPPPSTERHVQVDITPELIEKLKVALDEAQPELERRLKSFGLKIHL